MYTITCASTCADMAQLVTHIHAPVTPNYAANTLTSQTNKTGKTYINDVSIQCVKHRM